MSERNDRKQREGVVVSDKMDKTDRKSTRLNSSHL